MKKRIVLAAALFLPCCAKITVTPVDSAGVPIPGAADGFRVPTPKPYLIVAELPVDPPQPTSAQNGTGRAAAGTGTMANTSKQSPNSAQSTSPPTTASPSDLSFEVSTHQYFMKLVYLPDYSTQYAITSSTGIGSATINPNFQDGWMLSSFNGSADTQASEFVTALASLVSSIGGTVGGAATGGGAAKAVGSAASGVNRAGVLSGSSASLADNILQPGIYRFEYNKQGFLIGLTRLTGFCSQTGIRSEADMDNYIAALSTQTYSEKHVPDLPDNCAAQTAQPEN